MSLPWCCRQPDFMKYRNLNEGYSRFRYPSVPCYQTTRRHIPEDSNFHNHHLDNMKSHFVVSTEPATVLFLQPTLKFRQLRLSFLVYFKRSVLSSLFLVPFICSVVPSVANCPRLFPIYDALHPHRHYLSAIFIFQFYLLNPLTYNNRYKN